MAVNSHGAPGKAPPVSVISGISNGGWNHLWVLYADDVDQDTLIKRPQAAFVEQVYYPGDFSLLGIGT